MYSTELNVDERVETISFALSSPIVDPTHVEQLLSPIVERTPSGSFDMLHIDLALVRYISVKSLMHLIAYINKLVQLNEGLDIKLLLPDDDKVVRFLCTWDFHVAVEHVYGRGFDTMLSGLDAERFEYTYQRVQRTRSQVNYPSRNQLNHVVNQEFFSFRPYDLKPHHTDSQWIFDFASAKADEWNDWAIRNVLDYYVHDIHGNASNGQIANNIFFECVTNALRHPNATKLQVVSKFTNGRRMTENLQKIYPSDDIESIPSSFALVFWDNGMDIVSTLKDSYKKNKTVRSQAEVTHMPRFEVWLDSQRVGHLDGDTTLNKETESYNWLISAFCPGITSDPFGETYMGELEPGMGLSNLLDTAIGAFGGSISVRSAHHALELTRSNTDDRGYHAQVQSIGASREFNGNLVAVSIPVKDEMF